MCASMLFMTLDNECASITLTEILTADFDSLARECLKFW